MVIAGWLLYSGLNLAMTSMRWSQGSIVGDGRWFTFSTELFIGLVLFPVAFSFAIRTFPLYLRLPAADWQVRRFSIFYLLSLALYLFPVIPFWHLSTNKLLPSISTGGSLLRSCAILWLIWKLDVLMRARRTWLQKYNLVFLPQRKPTRPDMPDYGEFGRFELLIYAAFIWLFLGATGQIVNAFTILFSGTVFFSAAVIRHIYLLGFISNLILGMAPRMIPAFLGIKKIKFPGVVTFCFFLINFAAVGRILPRLLPEFAVRAGAMIYGVSGLFALAAILSMWFLLYQSIEKAGRNSQ